MSEGSCHHILWWMQWHRIYFHQIDKLQMYCIWTREWILNQKNNIKVRKYLHIHVNITCTKCFLGLRICTIAIYCYSRTHESYRYYIWRMFLSVSCERKMWVPFGVNMYLSSVTCICHYECKPIFHIYCVYMGF